MPVQIYGFVLKFALYCSPATCAYRAARLEWEAGNEKLCRQHQLSALLYALLGAVQAVGV